MGYGADSRAERGPRGRIARVAGAPHSGLAFDRFVTFTDGIVAIAITLQVLPLINIEGPKPGETIWSVLLDNSGQILAFLISFVVVAFQWLLHNRIVNRMRAYDAPFFWINALWLLGIVLLPWITALFGSASVWDGTDAAADGEGFGGVGLLYWGTLAFISVMIFLMSTHLLRHPDLISPDRRDEWDEVMASRERWRGVVFPVAFLLLGVGTEVVPQWSQWLPFLLFPVSFILRRHPGSARADAEDAEDSG